MRMIVRKKLAELGLMQVYEACDGQQAMEILSEQELKRESIGLICSDWSMPRMTGIELLRQVRTNEKYRGLPFLMITAESENKSVDQARELNVSGFVSKPFSSEQFFAALGTVWNKHHSQE